MSFISIGTMAITEITTDVHELVDEVRLPARFRLPVRMTIVRLPGRQLLLYSPVPIDDTAAAGLAELGEVAWLIAPSKYHHRWLAAAAERYPRAAVWDARRGEPFPAALAAHLDHVAIAGAPKIDETVLFHRASRSLICADFLFYMTRPANWITRTVLALAGTGGGRLAVSRDWRLLVKDRAAARTSVQAIRRWDIARVIVGHGDVFEGDVAAALDAAGLARITG
jgi:hypothetical protein